MSFGQLHSDHPVFEAPQWFSSCGETAVFRFFFTWVNCFFTWVKLLLSASTDVLSSGSLMVLLSLLVRSFILRIFQTVDLATPDVVALSNGFGLIFFQPNNTLLHWDWQLFGSYNNRFHWPLTCFINEEIVKICPWNSFGEDYPSNFGPLSRGRLINCCNHHSPYLKVKTLQSNLKVCI